MLDDVRANALLSFDKYTGIQVTLSIVGALGRCGTLLLRRLSVHRLNPCIRFCRNLRDGLLQLLRSQAISVALPQQEHDAEGEQGQKNTPEDRPMSPLRGAVPVAMHAVFIVPWHVHTLP